MASAWDPNVAEREAQKKSKYRELAADLAHQWPQYKVTNFKSGEPVEPNNPRKKKRSRLVDIPASEKSGKHQEVVEAEARTKLLTFLAEMDISSPGPQPFKQRIPIATRSTGSQVAQLTEAVDNIIEDIWTNEMEISQRNLWTLNCLTFAGGRTVEVLGGKKSKVSPTVSRLK